MKIEKENLDKKIKECQEKKNLLEKSQQNESQKKIDLEKLIKETELLEIQKRELAKKERNAPWNVDTISKQKFSKTMINKKEENKNYDEMNEEEKEKQMKEFIKSNETKIKKYGMLRRFEDSKEFLLENNLLVHEDTANYLVLWCINLEIEEKHELMTHVAHQCICMQYILELSRQLQCDPRSCIRPFFDRIQIADAEYKRQFEDEILSFISRIEKRAKEKIAEALKEQEEEEEKERKARIGPGGLDPAEVFESLPKDLQECFESRDTELLKTVISKMPEDEAKYHMKRCVDSGLWIADANVAQNTDNSKEGIENYDLD